MKKLTEDQLILELASTKQNIKLELSRVSGATVLREQDLTRYVELINYRDELKAEERRREVFGNIKSEIKLLFKR